MQSQTSVGSQVSMQSSESGEQQARVNGESNRDNVISAQCSDCQSGEANDWRNREHVVLDPFSNLKMGKILW